MIALAGGLLILVLLFAYFATNRNADQDKLTEGNASSAAADEPEKLCASKSTYDLIKRELFRRAGELRGSDQAAFDKLAAFAVVRMENPVMESQDSKTRRSAARVPCRSTCRRALAWSAGGARSAPTSTMSCNRRPMGAGRW